LDVGNWDLGFLFTDEDCSTNGKDEQGKIENKTQNEFRIAWERRVGDARRRMEISSRAGRQRVRVPLFLSRCEKIGVALRVKM
jgi:hypothetical protein